MTDNDNTATRTTSDWKTTSSSGSHAAQAEIQPPKHRHKREHPSRRPTDPLDEFFYEQAKFFRHLERKYERFNHKSKEDERYARAGKFKHRPKSKSKDQQQQQQVPQQHRQPRLIGPITQQQAIRQEKDRKALESKATKENKGEIQRERR